MWSLKQLALEIVGTLDSGDTPDDLDFGDLDIPNGSSFYDMNSTKTYMYDAESETWIEQTAS